jgi:hypothetical protein
MSVAIANAQNTVSRTQAAGVDQKLTHKQKERRADHFAGAALAARGASLDVFTAEVSDLPERIAAARAGYLEQRQQQLLAAICG